MSDRVRLAEVSDLPLDVSRVYDAVPAAAGGAVSVFVGVVRDHDGGRSVASLSYTAHPHAADLLRTVLVGIADADDEVLAIAAVHRVGDLAIGDIAIVVAVVCAHRQEAFDACSHAVAEIKARVPIWKRQVFADGSEEWVGTP